MICDKCLHADLCGMEGAHEEATTYCANFLGWIPVSEELPKETDCYIVTRQIGSDLIVGVCYFDRPDTWYDDTRVNRERNCLTDIVAWMPLPKPYEPQESEGGVND